MDCPRCGWPKPGPKKRKTHLRRWANDGPLCHMPRKFNTRVPVVTTKKAEVTCIACLRRLES